MSNTKAVLLIALLSLVFSNVTGQQYGSDCATNSDCNEEANLYCLGNKCECVEGHTSNRVGNCTKTYNESCAHILNCNIDRYLTCDENNLCTCQKPLEQIFDNGPRKACVSLIGYSCAHQSAEFSLNCVEGAYCDMPIINGSMTHKCKCNPEWEATDQKTCKEIVFGNNLFGSDCTTNSDCDERANLFCSSNKCQCTAGHTSTARKTCKKIFGEDCGTNLECNEDRFLKCTDTQPDLTTKCQCAKPTEQIYEAGSINACVSLVGFECSMETGEYFLQCVEGGFCDMPIVDGIMLHKCKCNVGWGLTVNLTCEETGMDHSMSMSMTFHTGTDETVLFDFWKTKETGAFIASLIVIFLMAFAYEALKFVRELLYERAMKQAKHSTSSTGLLVGSSSIMGTIFNTWHITQTLLHMFQFVLSYFLMLIFMTYNVWLGLAITLGAGVGFICFGWKKTPAFNNNDHCQ